MCFEITDSQILWEKTIFKRHRVSVLYPEYLHPYLFVPVSVPKPCTLVRAVSGCRMGPPA